MASMKQPSMGYMPTVFLASRASTVLRLCTTKAVFIRTLLCNLQAGITNCKTLRGFNGVRVGKYVVPTTKSELHKLHVN